MLKHKNLKNKMLSDEKVKTEYDSLAVEFALLKEMLAARKKAGLTQAQVAERMGTKQTAINRLESVLVTGGHSPRIATLEKYANAVGRKLLIKLV